MLSDATATECRCPVAGFAALLPKEMLEAASVLGHAVELAAKLSDAGLATLVAESMLKRLPGAEASSGLPSLCIASLEMLWSA